MKKQLIVSTLIVALMATSASAAVTMTSTVIVGNGTTRVTQSEVLNSQPGAGTSNMTIPIGGININSKWSFLLVSDQDIASISTITFTVTGPSASFSDQFQSSVYNVVTSAGEPTIGVYTSGNINVSTANGVPAISGKVLDPGTVKLALASYSIPAAFQSNNYNPDQVGENLQIAWTVTGNYAVGGTFSSSSTSTITVIPEPSAGLMGMIGLTGFLILRRRRLS
jgi:hypothetical protein